MALTLIIDAGPLISLCEILIVGQKLFGPPRRLSPGDLVIPAPVTAEVDYLLRRHGGPDAGRRFIEELADGRFLVGCIDSKDHARAASLDQESDALNLGLADASVAVLAEKYQTRRILTFDQRHFRRLEPLQGGSFTLLPADLI